MIRPEQEADIHTDVLIVGGGLAGLALADGLVERGIEYHLVEGRARFGGRILTEHLDAGYFDMGPAWFWPGQPRMDALVTRLGAVRFEQFADGILIQEDERGQVHRGRGFASMQGSWRLRGGFGALIKGLIERLDGACLHLNSAVIELENSDTNISASLSNGRKIIANRIVLAIPPRVATMIKFTPDLPAETIDTMRGVSTWMAGQAKAIAVYDTPFWREAGLSGDAMSRLGPMVEIHDASPDHTGLYALFGFIGVPAQNRHDETALQDAVRAQFTRLFGKQAGAPRQLYLMDWAQDPFTAVSADQHPMYSHPHYGLPRTMSGLWEDRLMFGGTEVASQFGGYLEGALEAVEDILNCLKD